MSMRERMISVSISMPPELAQRLRVLAAQKDESRSRFVCDVLTKALSTNDVVQVQSEEQEVYDGEE